MGELGTNRDADGGEISQRTRTRDCKCLTLPGTPWTPEILNNRESHPVTVCSGLTC